MKVDALKKISKYLARLYRLVGKLPASSHHKKCWKAAFKKSGIDKSKTDILTKDEVDEKINTYKELLQNDPDDLSISHDFFSRGYECVNIYGFALS